MRIAIVSDIHANLEALRASLDDMSARTVDRVVCLGDIVGYNTNPAECIALLRALDPICVAGNHDRAVTGQITTEGFSHTAARAVAWTRERLAADALAYLSALPAKASLLGHLVLVHGALHPDTGCEIVRLDNDPGRLASLEALAAHPSGARICAFGHTHRPGVFAAHNGVVETLAGDEIILREDAFYLINPGTVGQPRTADRRATYLILDTVRQALSFHCVAYDAAVAFEKTRRAGLGPRFSFLPRLVREPLKKAARALGRFA